MITEFVAPITQNKFTSRVFLVGVGIVLFMYLFFAEFTAHTLFPHFMTAKRAALCDSHFECLTGLIFIGFAVRGFSLALFGAFIYTVVAFVGLLIMLGSAQLDFVEEKDWPEIRRPFVLLTVTFIFIWATIALLAVIAGPVSSGTGHPAWIGLLSLIGLPLVFFVGLIVAPPFIPLVGGCVIGGMLCLPRAVIFWTTVSKIRNQWQGLQDGNFVDGNEMANALGEASSSSAHARALHKEVHKMTGEARADVARLREENKRLSVSIEEDTTRFKKEAELSSLMAEAEELRIKNEILKEHQPSDKKMEK